MAADEKQPTNTWVRRAREHFIKTGAYHHSDVRRILGNPMGKVDIVPMSSEAVQNVSAPIGFEHSQKKKRPIG
jgi:poly-gamma-glutamate capsule biosynthesis protein CapA/YwtB (metallophosphatase superfamily)